MYRPFSLPVATGQRGAGHAAAAWNASWVGGFESRSVHAVLSNDEGMDTFLIVLVVIGWLVLLAGAFRVTARVVDLAWLGLAIIILGVWVIPAIKAL